VFEQSQAAAERRYAVYEQLAGITAPAVQDADEEPVNTDLMET